jgi:nucleoside-diphosphate-sugar epimerase
MPAGPVALHTRLESRVEEMEAELRRFDSVASGARFALIHLAARTGVEACAADPRHAHLLNVDGSRKWLAAAAKSGCARFVFVSTAHVFAAAPDGERLTESSPVGPLTVYARTKLAAEDALASDVLRHPGTQLTIARVFGVRSPALRPGFLWTRLVEQARAQSYRPIAGLRCVRDYLDAAEVCRVLLRLAKAPEAPRLALVCSGVPVTVRELAERAFRENGADPARIVEAPPRDTDAPHLVGVPTVIA